ncbi:uncharacterized protein EV420DRAFT_1521692 [Desarmillaria tabescens]|uniref:Uncharacterized protein n=1 Tax=Armillaria tabescens TaxID=1929756 RepID=A0AA39TQF6_ARMTA|nr:uncharacterized protein EV420DRAFT_1521692 [Desarmillaria tabescens]KAK0462928.1 hypothetical protein EV420DRAFT_1521692 [Desarmillaria tabescens]
MDRDATVRHHSLIITKECFRAIQASVNERHRGVKVIVDQIAAVVPHICRWIIYFYSSYFLNATADTVLPSETVDLRDQFKDSLLSLLDSFSVDFVSVMRTSGLYQMYDTRLDLLRLDCRLCNGHVLLESYGCVGLLSIGRNPLGSYGRIGRVSMSWHIIVCGELSSTSKFL